MQWKTALAGWGGGIRLLSECRVAVCTASFLSLIAKQSEQCIGGALEVFIICPGS